MTFFASNGNLKKNEPQIKNTIYLFIYLSVYFVLFVYLILSNVQQKGYEVHNGWCK